MKRVRHQFDKFPGHSFKTSVDRAGFTGFRLVVRWHNALFKMRRCRRSTSKFAKVVFRAKHIKATGGSLFTME